MADPRAVNIWMLSIGFLLVFISFQTMQNILITVLDSVKKENANYYGDAYIGLCIVYIVLALSNFLAPAIISVLGTRLSILLGSITYAFYILSFYLTRGWILYLASIVLGFGAALIWTAQGTYLTLNSNATTIARNSAIFWALFQCSTLIGNTFVFFAFQQKDIIDLSTRRLVYGFLSVICIAGIIVLALLRAAVDDYGDIVIDTKGAPKQAFTAAFGLLKTRNVQLLLMVFLFTGFHQSFSGSVYSSCIGFTAEMSQYPKMWIGLSGILFGLGEVAGGTLFGVLSDKTTKWGRNPIVIFGTIVLLVAYVLIWNNIPSNAIFGETHDVSRIKPPNAALAVLCSFLLGFGDSSFNTQIYSIIATLFKTDSAPAFAIFKFIQSIAAGLSFLYAKKIPLHPLIIGLIVFMIIGTVTYFLVERQIQKKEAAELQEALSDNR